MKVRTCPNCGYKYSFSHHLKKHFFQNVFSEWNCKNCGTSLTVDAKRRILLALVGIVPVGLLPIMTDFLMGYYLGSKVSWILSSIMVLIWAVFIFSLDHFCVAEKSQVNKE